MRILSSENLILLQRCFCWDQPTRSMQSSPRPDAGTQPLCPCRPLLARDAGPAKTRVARPIGSYFPRGSGKQAKATGQRPLARGGGGDGLDRSGRPDAAASYQLARANRQGCCWLLCVFSLPACSVRVDPLRLRRTRRPGCYYVNMACSCDSRKLRVYRCKPPGGSLGQSAQHCTAPGVACLY